tara:strand:- start:58 stop:1035 length:978 start_codon:yes stop_codon:yes gene_type:complete
VDLNQFKDKNIDDKKLVQVGGGILVSLVVIAFIVVTGNQLGFFDEEESENNIKTQFVESSISLEDNNDTFIEDQLGELDTGVTEIQSNMVISIDDIRVIAKAKAVPMKKRVEDEEETKVGTQKKSESKSNQKPNPRPTVKEEKIKKKKVVIYRDYSIQNQTKTPDPIVRVPISTKLNAELLSDINSLYPTTIILARITDSYPKYTSIKGATLIGKIQPLFNLNRVAIHFETLVIDDKEYSISAIAQADDRKDGLVAKAEDNTGESMVKSFGEGAVELVGGRLSTPGQRALNRMSEKKISTIQDSKILMVDKGVRFTVFFTKTVAF